MSCDGIPTHLHKGTRPILCMKSIGNPKDLIYRIKPDRNPIEVPDGMPTALSCKWSHLIKQTEIHFYYANNIGNSVGVSSMLEIHKFKVTNSNPEENNEFHKLSCLMSHKPEECDYAHIEIDIFHEIFKTSDEKDKIYEEHVTYDSWKRKKALLKKRKSEFYKELRREYRAKLINELFLKELKKKWFFCIFNP